MKKKIINLLKSGNFTLVYHDNGFCQLYKGKINYEATEDTKEIASFSACEEGYIPGEVLELVKALGGKVETI